MRLRANSLRVFGAPLVLAMLTVLGLVLALLADGIWDVFSSLALAVPLLVIAVCWWRA